MDEITTTSPANPKRVAAKDLRAKDRAVWKAIRETNKVLWTVPELKELAKTLDLSEGAMLRIVTKLHRNGKLAEIVTKTYRTRY